MSESERLAATIAEYETEQTTLVTELQALAERVKAAEVAADAAAAHAGRHPSPEADAASTAAEEERQALESQIRRKRAALAACERDLSTARHGLAASRRAAQFVQIQTVLDEIAARCLVIQEDPLQPALWGELAEQVALAKRLWVTAGGRSNDWIGDVLWAKNKLHNALSLHCDWAIGKRVESPPPIPIMSELMQLQRANGFAKELLGKA